MSINKEIAMYSINDVLDALAKVSMEEGTAEDLASELTGLSIDKLWEIGEDRLPFYFLHDIVWDPNDDSDKPGLPESCFIRACNEDMINDTLLDALGSCAWEWCRVLSCREDAKTHAMNILFKKGYNRDEAEKLLESTSVLEEKVITDSTILALATKEGRPV